MTPEFEGFQKIYRWNRPIVVTEKIDGTNAQVHITDAGDIVAGSRNRFLKPGDDNFGFAAFVEANKADLLSLGPGTHYGEWWGSGIQRGYGLKERRFSLFNTARWGETRPKCCDVVPVLWTGMAADLDLDAIGRALRAAGSIAAPGFINPEGVVIYHSASRQLFKYTLDKNDGHKGEQ